MSQGRDRSTAWPPLAAVAVLAAGACGAVEPVIGGPCEGCELVFEQLPEHLESAARIAPEGEPGEPLLISGQVSTQDGAAAPGVIVYAHHTDAGVLGYRDLLPR